MNILDQNFIKSVEIVNNMIKRPSDNELLNLYGLFKQANEGDNNSPEPGFMNVKGCRKWTSWRAHLGKSKEQAKQEYISFVMNIFPKYT